MIKDNHLYNESCLETMKKMPDGFINLIITSPPYNMNLRLSKGKYISRELVKEFSTKYDGFNDNLPIEEFYEFHKKALEEMLRVSGLIFYVIQIVTGSKIPFFKMIGDFHDKLKEIIVWDKCHGIPSMQHQVLNRRSELILVFENSHPKYRQFKEAPFARGTLDDIWQIKRESKRSRSSYHGAAFPEELVEKVLTNFSNEGDRVYDPFLGTGTTALVARRMNRRYVGSELLPNYLEIAENRLNANLF